eukprot:GHUV01034366.1.p1 GENE.GHUV01034366.1~~GHUV01034366.1.p1  ORF type:complete len:154 (+),score=16.48 GHUV01034366.1:665-1126(+)
MSIGRVRIDLLNSNSAWSRQLIRDTDNTTTCPALAAINHDLLWWFPVVNGVCLGAFVGRGINQLDHEFCCCVTDEGCCRCHAGSPQHGGPVGGWQQGGIGSRSSAAVSVEFMLTFTEAVLQSTASGWLDCSMPTTESSGLHMHVAMIVPGTPM